jgi:hypothetical protein
MFSPFCGYLRPLILALSCSLPTILSPFSAVASQSVQVVFSSGSDSVFVSYNVYYGTASHNYDNQVAVGNTNVATIPGLADGVTYYFAVVGVDDNGDESAYSDEVSFTTAMPVTTTIATPVATTLTPVPEPPGVIGFSVSGGSSPVYVVQTSTDLVNWVSVQMFTIPFTFTDVCSPDVPQRFYRTYCPAPSPNPTQAPSSGANF